MFLSVLFAAAWTAPSTAAAQNTCWDCHASLARQASAGEETTAHVSEWRRSSHAGSGVDCADCHGGRPEAFNELLAHQGVYHSHHPESRTNPRNLPATCGACHTTIFAAYRDSPHYPLLTAGVDFVPTCTTCHGTLATEPYRLGQAGCRRCHGSEPESTAPDLRGRGTPLLEELREVEKTRAALKRRVDKLKRSALRHELEVALAHAEAPWQEAIDAGHGFDWPAWETSLAEARARLDAIQTELDAQK